MTRTYIEGFAVKFHEGKAAEGEAPAVAPRIEVEEGAPASVLQAAAKRFGVKLEEKPEELEEAPPAA